MAFAVTLPVRFGDCDAAAIGYYPRLLALVDAAIEDWTVAVIGVDRQTMHQRDRLGLPTVSLSSAFTAPCRLGEQLDLRVDVTAIGARSVTLGVTATVAGSARFSVELVQVLMDLETSQSAPWPAAWRAAIAANITGGDQPG